MSGERTPPKIRIAIIFIRDPEGRFFIHQRADHKAVFPGLIGFGAGGRIEPGEAAVEGAARELREEAGLDVPMRHVADFPFLSGDVLYTVYFYAVTTTEEIPNHDEEWAWSRWVDFEEACEFIAAGYVCPDSVECFERLARE